LTILSGNEGWNIKTDDSDYYPPWETTSDETEVSYSGKFDSCEDVLASLSARNGDNITERRYFVSPRWGSILRARAVTEDKGWKSETLITCWSKTDPYVEFVITVDGSRN
jgi:hypothetical protein